MAKVLFILKRREDYDPKTHSHVGLSTGLYNSASFMSSMLNGMDIPSEVAVVRDNNDIDREVAQRRPTHVIIEALWVVPTKFSVLQQLHPDVTWIIRLHSDMPFIAGEGMAMDWLGDYSGYDRVVIAANAQRMLRETRLVLQLRNGWDAKQAQNKVIYLPNYYPQSYRHKRFNHTKSQVDICCFGAVRPMKNHLLQAVAAIEFAERLNKKLRFHINAGRVEGKGEPVMRNLQSLFEHLHHTGHELVSHTWTPREQFLELCSTMDIGLQVSLSETFNIVGADLISQGIPLVGSAEIPWAASWFAADPNSSDDMVNKLHLTWELSQANVWLQQWQLKRYTTQTKLTWKQYLTTK